MKLYLICAAIFSIWAIHSALALAQNITIAY